MFQSELCFWRPVDVSPVCTPLLALFWPLPTLEGNFWLLNLSKLHYVHELFADFVCLPYVAGQISYNGFI